VHFSLLPDAPWESEGIDSGPAMVEHTANTFCLCLNRVKKTYMGLEGHVDNQGDPTERCQNTSNSGWFARNVAA
jgi:hypothetical protein